MDTMHSALAHYIDHTILRQDATLGDVLGHADQAIRHGFRAVCVNPIHVALITERLAGTPVGRCSVVGFPLGATPSSIKAAETRQAIADGATEIDMVIDIGALRDGRNDAVLRDIRAVREACTGALLKVIIECCLLDDAQKRAACLLSVEAGADFVKTSTGFSTGGATVADIGLMRAAVGPDIGVKASGGVRSFAQANALIAAGATRIGASNGVALLVER